MGKRANIGLKKVKEENGVEFEMRIKIRMELTIMADEVKK